MNFVRRFRNRKVDGQEPISISKFKIKSFEMFRKSPILSLLLRNFETLNIKGASPQFSLQTINLAQMTQTLSQNNFRPKLNSFSAFDRKERFFTNKIHRTSSEGMAGFYPVSSHCTKIRENVHKLGKLAEVLNILRINLK